MNIVELVSLLHVGEDGEKEEHYSIVGGISNWYRQLWKSIWRFLRKLEIDLPEDPAISLLGKYPKDVSPGHGGTCFSIFIVALFVVARSWKQPRCLTIEEWIQKMWFIYTMEYYSAIKNNEFMKFLGKWMDLEDIILSEVTQSQRNTHDMH